jgi:acyl-CoA synthetase (AMP-forming)/AMP-acid ligase II
MVIKPKGYQVFPDDVVNHISKKLGAKAPLIACVGAEHEVFSEAIMVFVEPAAGQTVTPDEVMDSCQDISAYSRPSHVVILDPGAMPLNRVAKVDMLVLQDRAREIVKDLRSKGGWDRK